MSKKIIGLFEISMLVLFSFSFAYIVNETNSYFDDYNINNEENKLIKYLREKILNWLGNGMVSAQPVLHTCIEDNNGVFCQEYIDGECGNVCVNPPGSCLPTTRENTEECQLGTCYDSTLGVCNDGTPKEACLNLGGAWSATRQPECNRNCCLINPDGSGGGDQAQYTTQQECNYLGQSLGFGELWTSGANIDWVAVGNEVECLLLANSQAEGACVLEFIEEEQKSDCEFLKKSDCLVRGGDFYEDRLCTDPVLNTICEITQETSCFEDSDEVYFVDSCGNRANIYDSTKVGNIGYWSDGVSKSDSCSLESVTNPLGRQSQCGNCDYLLGSKCGEVTDENVVYGDFVCKDLNCVDEWGNDRKHGESWCAFDGKIGLDGGDRTNAERSVDVPGSRHYKKVCFDGEVRTEPCADFRQEVCVESTDEQIDFSSASCRVNLWHQCFESNEDDDERDKCEETSGCFLKKIDIDKYFEFDVCAPKYPPGWDLRAAQGGEVGESVCGIASQTCTYIEEKKITGWTCVANCDCKDEGFTETMNNLCMSLGDCGGNINLAGEFTNDGYSESGADDLSQGYINSLQTYKNTVQGQSADALTDAEIQSIFGISVPDYSSGEVFDIISHVIGLGGLGVALGFAVYGSIHYGVSLGFVFGEATGSQVGAALGGGGTAALGVMAGAAVGFLIGQVLGIQGDGLLAVTLAGALGGGLAATVLEGVISELFFLNVIAFAGLFALAIAAIVLIIGLGDTREKEVIFNCRPWQPPTGGSDCDLCNENELGCSRYKCQSLGQRCEFINPGTEEESCIDVNPNDANAPVINVWEDVISEGYEYVNSQTGVGTEIEKNEGDGCLREYEPVEFGITLDEPGQCKWDTEHTGTYDEMSNFLDGNLYKFNHSDIMAMPTLDELGASGIDPARRENYDVYVRCRDSSGNPEGASLEYNVRFCVKPTDDIQPPIINEFVPETGFVGLGVEEFNLQFYTNEPATCKWDFDGTKEYDGMENDVYCLSGINSVTSGPSGQAGWRCNVILPVGEEEVKDYFFKCKDQPWLGSASTDRRAMTESEKYTLQKTTTPLEISSVSPDNENLFFGSIPAIVDLQIETSGGIDGNAFCEWSFDENIFIDFFPTGGQIHSFHFNQLTEGNYDVSLMCTDSAGNEATGNSVFDIEIDNQGPVITRVYNSGGTLNVITNEPAECRYGFEGCGFTFEEGEAMSGTSYSHTTSITLGQTYKVKCQDRFGNTGSCLSVTGGY